MATPKVIAILKSTFISIFLYLFHIAILIENLKEYFVC